MKLCFIPCFLLFLAVPMVASVQVTKQYQSYGNAVFAGAGACVNGTDMADSVGKRGPFVECMVACNANTNCGSFWVMDTICNIVDKTACADVMVRKEATDGVTYYVK